MSELLNWLIKKENRKTCRIVGLIFVILPLIYYLSRGFSQDIDGHGIIFSSGWFREVFIVVLVIMLCIGLILTAVGFSKREKWKFF